MSQMKVFDLTLFEPMLRFFEEECLNPGVPEFPAEETNQERLRILQQAYLAISLYGNSKILQSITWQDVCKSRGVIEVSQMEAALEAHGKAIV